MRITDETVIKDGEKELIDTIIGDLDWAAIEDIFKEKHQLDIQDDVEYRQGDIVVHDNDVAYKLDFDVKVTLSILFDRSGNSLSIETSGDLSKELSPTEEDDSVAGEIEGATPQEALEEVADETALVGAATEEPSISNTPEDIPNINDDVAEPSNDTAEEIAAVSEEEDIPALADEVAEDITAGVPEDMEQIAEEDPLEAADEEEAEPPETITDDSSEADDVSGSQPDQTAHDMAASDEENMAPLEAETDDPQPEEAPEEPAVPVAGDDIEVTDIDVDSPGEDPEDIALSIEESDEVTAADPMKQPAENITDMTSEIAEMVTELDEETV